MYISIIQKGSYKYIVAITLISLALGSFSVGSLLNAHAVSDLKVKISINEDDVERGDTQKVTVTVSDNEDKENKISDAKVKLKVYPPESDSTTAEDETDDDGKAKFNVKIDDDAELGTYDIEAQVSKKGYDTEIEESSFDVVSSSTIDDDRDDDDGNNDKGGKDGKDDHHNGDNDNDKDSRHNGDDENANGDSQDQTMSQGNACGNGLLSTNVLCQNVANQLQGDGNAINIIALQKGSNDKTEGLVGGQSPSSTLTSTSSSPSSSSLNDDDNSENDSHHNGDDENANGDSQDQTMSQGNACGNGLLSTNVLCQNVANQLQGDGNAINIIALQKGSNDKTELGSEGLVSGQSPSTSSSSSSSSSLSPYSRTSGQDQARSFFTGLTNDESLASMVDRYKQARIDKAIELRMSYLR